MQGITQDDQRNAGLTAADFAFRVIEGIDPLPDDPAATDVPACPPALAYDLFGRAETDTPLHCYAILDAARIEHLPEQLDAARLEHRCLFKGAVAQDLADVAPWLVLLPPDHAFTRALFTQGDVPWLHWGKDPGLLLRSALPLDALWSHVRKFTRCPDETGKWVFFKFWEPALLRTIADMPHRFPEYLARYGQIMGADITALVSVTEGDAFVLTRSTPHLPRRVPFTLPNRLESRRLILHRKMVLAAQDTFELGPDWTEQAYGTPRALSFLLREYIDFCLDNGIDNAALRGDLMGVLFSLDHPRWPGCLATPQFARIAQDRTRAEERALDWMYRVQHDVARMAKGGT